MKKICIVTGTRADYGLLRGVLHEISQSNLLVLQLIVTGMHLSPEFGMTVDEIEADGFEIDYRVEMLLSSDSSVGVTKSMGLGMIGFADALAKLKPDIMLVLGDRFEIFVAAASAVVARIPIAHLHGGEKSEGSFDESFRHCITKMANLHFVATDEYRRRVIQLGEPSDRVFQVGGLGVDSIHRLNLLSRTELENELKFKFAKRNLLVTFHPVTFENNTSSKQMGEILAALANLDDTGIIFTMPNADNQGRVIGQQIEDFCSRHHLAKAYTSLGQTRYLSCLKFVDGVVGNSSSGLTEVPSFKKATINIGDRQRGRLKAKPSVVDCKPDRQSIVEAINYIFSARFQAQLVTTKNPYGKRGASEEVVKILENQRTDQEDFLKKKFYDLL
jgi:GDP/UDP-N,N'-diacetylbacillosamine 2-epimerase (hydrolysing)